MRRTVLVFVVLAFSILSAATVTARGRTRTTLVSVDSNEVPADGNSDVFSPDLSRTGRFVAFASLANNLSAHDSDGTNDVFVRDHRRGRTLLVSQSSDEVGGNGESLRPSISRGGRIVAFQSDATNLVAGDANATHDVFVRNIRKGRTELVSLSSSEVYGNGFSERPSLSRTGRFVAFTSASTNLTGTDTDSALDVFVRDRRRGLTALVSQSSNEVPGDGSSRDASISGNGRFVAFTSNSTNLTGSDTDSDLDVFLRDRRLGRTYLVSQSSNEVAGNDNSYQPSVSGNGRFVAFTSDATNLAGTDTNGDEDVYVRDMRLGRTYLASQSSSEVLGTQDSFRPSISGSGRFVTFMSVADNLTGGDTNTFRDVFVRDLKRGRTYLVSQSDAGDLGQELSGEPGISANGRFVAFLSQADNFSPVDNDTFLNVFRRGPLHY